MPLRLAEIVAPAPLTMPPKKVETPVSAMPLPSVSVSAPLLVMPPEKVDTTLT